MTKRQEEHRKPHRAAKESRRESRTIIEEYSRDRAGEAASHKGAVFLLVLAAAALASVLVGIIGGRGAWSGIYSAAGLSEAVPAPIAENACVYYFDVGQGDSSLILADGYSILIDSGEYSEAGRVISDLYSAGVEKLDYVIATHPHSDHIGGMGAIMYEFPAKTLILPDIPEENISAAGSYTAMLEAAGRNKTEIRRISSDCTVNLGADSKIQIFRTPDDSENMNNNSLVLRFSFGGTSFIFCGDIEEDAENFLLNENADIDSDVIKVPHHGSSTSDNREFVQKVSPAYAVISVGESNDYGHPHKSVTELYESLGTVIYRTDKNGNIAAFTDGVNIKFAA